MNSNRFNYNLSKYINTGCLNRSDKLISLVSSEIPFKKNASKIIQEYNKNGIAVIGNSVSYICNKYNGTNSKVLDIMHYLQTELSDDLKGAFLHGSIATNEGISYSDFDGLVIIKNEVFKDKLRLAKVAMKLSKAYSLMISMDALQHHGWFVVTEKDCKNWPSNYFPPILFEYAKSLLFSNTIVDITYLPSHEKDTIELKRLCESVANHLRSQKIPENSFQLKSILSEFMLLPSLYIQYKTGNGIYKKHSFEEAAKDFSDAEWQIMNEVSKIREKWHLNNGIKIGEKPLIVTPWIKKKQIKKSSKISEELRIKMDPEFIGRMIKFTNLIRAKII